MNDIIVFVLRCYEISSLPFFFCFCFDLMQFLQFTPSKLTLIIKRTLVWNIDFLRRSETVWPCRGHPLVRATAKQTSNKYIHIIHIRPKNKMMKTKLQENGKMAKLYVNVSNLKMFLFQDKCTNIFNWYTLTELCLYL